MGTFGGILLLVGFWILIESVIDDWDRWWGNGE